MHTYIASITKWRDKGPYVFKAHLDSMDKLAKKGWFQGENLQGKDPLSAPSKIIMRE